MDRGLASRRERRPAARPGRDLPRAVVLARGGAARLDGARGRLAAPLGRRDPGRLPRADRDPLRLRIARRRVQPVHPHRAQSGQAEATIGRRRRAHRRGGAHGAREHQGTGRAGLCGSCRGPARGDRRRHGRHPLDRRRGRPRPPDARPGPRPPRRARLAYRALPARRPAAAGRRLRPTVDHVPARGGRGPSLRPVCQRVARRLRHPGAQPHHLGGDRRRARQRAQPLLRPRRRRRRAPAGRVRRGARPGVAFLPDDLHSIHIEGPLLHFHLYGRALERLDRREYYDPASRGWKVFPAHSDIRDARSGRA